MKAERPRRLFRHVRLAAAIVAPLLSLGAVAVPAQDKKFVVRVSDSDLSRCGGSQSDKLASKKVCLRGNVRVVTTEARTARPQGGGLVEGALYFVGRDTYDERGNCTSLTRYNADGTFAAAGQRRYEYDAAGNWVTYVSFSRPSENAAPVPFIIVRRQIAYD